MEKYYFTFGSNHLAPETTETPGLSLGQYYVEITAEDMNQARSIMFERYSDKWAFCYSEKQFQPQINIFGLTKYESLSKSSK